MKTKGSNQSKKESWLKIIDEFNASGQKQSDFCKERGINKIKFLYYFSKWRKKDKDNSRKIVDGA